AAPQAREGALQNTRRARRLGCLPARIARAVRESAGVAGRAAQGAALTTGNVAGVLAGLNHVDNWCAWADFCRGRRAWDDRANAKIYSPLRRRFDAADHHGDSLRVGGREKTTCG